MRHIILSRKYPKKKTSTNNLILSMKVSSSSENIILKNDATLSSDNSLRFRINYYKMTISKIVRTINKKIEQNKDPYDLDNKKLRFWLFHQEILANINFCLANMFYRKRLVKIVATIKRFEYLLLGSELKKQIVIAKH